jgi:hypothetical protein
LAKIKLEQGEAYNIQPIPKESYSQCSFVFGIYEITAIDGQYFQVRSDNIEIQGVWWDSEGFAIT